jgi:outer membrane lipase/esterase
MRHPWSLAWARSTISAATLVAAVAGLAPGATAQEKFDRLFVFGDSYADLTLSDKPASSPLSSLPPGLGLSLWRVYPVPLAANLGIKGIEDVAVGGATASEFGSPPALIQLITPAAIKPGNLPQQVDGFIATNPSFSFGPRDLVTVSIGGNDFLQLFETSGKDPVTFGNDTAQLASGEIHKLVEKGARTFVIAGFSGMSNLGPEIIPDGAVETLADAYASAYFNALQVNLLPDAQKGTRFFMLDLFKLGAQAVADPRYGFTVTNVDAKGNIESRCASPAACPVNNPDNPGGVKFFLGPDGLHLTSDGFQLVADYMANIVIAPDTIAVQPGIVMASTSGFVSTVFGRLDATRIAEVGASMAPDGPMGLGATEKSRGPQAAPSSGRFTSYAMGTFLGGNRSDSADVVGYDYDSTSGTAGIEYSVNRNLVFGVAANYTSTSADLNNDANIDVDAVQGAAYLSYATRQMFAEALAAYGSHNVDLGRPGAVDFKPINSSTDASTFAVAARGGYLFDLGGLRAGPIAALTYIHTRVDGYTEKGDDLATFNVSAQTLDSLTGNLGLRFLAPFKAADGSLVIPYVNVMLEHQFGDDARTVTTTLTQAPLLPILTSSSNFEDRTYGRVEGGITLQLTPDLSATFTGASTFARDDGQDYRVSVGLNYRF